jgi:hypothetical protein
MGKRFNRKPEKIWSEILTKTEKKPKQMCRKYGHVWLIKADKSGFICDRCGEIKSP